ncbi:MAG TPA: methyltransferase domain-containing protein [Burkholderiaceae bacterium]|nr:methyltransferase domain-containing protein [Burkholderiaceae bacterium]
MPVSTCPCCASISAAQVSATVPFKCDQCGHRWRERLGREDHHEYYETLVARNDLQTPWFKRKIAERTAALSALLTPEVCRVLEVGCAEGELGSAIKARFAITYDGIELSLDGDHASKKLDRLFRTPAKNVVSDPYQLIVSFHVLEHIADPGNELMMWSRLLTPDGLLLIEVPNQAGHPLLSNDHNPEHLHQFTPASLTILLAKMGFSVCTLSLGNYESPVYPDSIRVTARRYPSADQQREQLLKRFHERLGGPFIAYGIGGDFHNYVAPLSDVLQIKGLLDASTTKRGQQVGRHRVTTYEAEIHGSYPVLICSIKFGADIRQDLESMGVPPRRIVGLNEIYDSP